MRNSPPEEELDDEAGYEWKPNHWSSAELAGPEYKMFQKRQREGGGVKNGNDRRAVKRAAK